MASSTQWHERIVRHFPQMPVGIGEVSRIPTPENFVSSFHQLTARRHSLSDDGIDFGFGRDIMGKRDA